MKVFVRARWRLQSKDDIRVILRAGHKAPVGISMDCLIIRHRRSFLKSFPRSLVLLLLPSAFCLLTFLAYLLIHRHLSCRPNVNGSHSRLRQHLRLKHLDDVHDLVRLLVQPRRGALQPMPTLLICCTLLQL